MTIASKLLAIAQNEQEVATQKEAIRQAIIAKDVAVPAETPLSQFPSKIAAIEGGGGYVEVHTVYIVDHTGIVAEIPVKHGDNLQLPAPLQYDNLVFTTYHGQTENITEDCIVAAMYETLNDYTYVLLSVTPVTGLSFAFYFYKNDSDLLRVYWGYEDSPGNESFSQSAASNFFQISKTFPAYGDYLIKCTHQKPYTLGYNGTNRGFIENGSGTIIRNVIKKIYVSKYTRLERFSLYTQSFLEELVLAYSITWSTILEGTFCELYSLKSLILPPSITALSNTSPYTWSNLRSLSVFYCASVITTARNSMFATNDQLQVATFDKIPAAFSLYGAFANCVSLKFVKIPEGVTTIGTELFRFSALMTCRELPSTLQRINMNAFESTSVRFSNIPNATVVLSDSCFKRCYELEFEEFPSQNTIYNSFSYTKFTEIVLKSNVTSIAVSAFVDMLNLQSVTIPASVSTIGATITTRCIALREFIFLGLIPPTISSTTFTTTLYYIFWVPDEAIDAYKTATNWTALAARILPISQRTAQ